ncbi:unnamed protein product [Albugo candida]|uniref:Uncharacterized protein n=1 Tax=Albugo candida TaxID=65357 RepID=A0A024GE99_9STRA|nr:unnamed protein product [Albugo candida]|eukprot:CCI44994.1 unnamed protein product [Albugo candida]
MTLLTIAILCGSHDTFLSLMPSGITLFAPAFIDSCALDPGTAFKNPLPSNLVSSAVFSATKAPVITERESSLL